MSNKLIFLLLLIIQVSLCFAQADKIYIVSLNLANETLTLEGLKLTAGFPEGRTLSPTQGYEYKVFSFDEEVLDRFYFEPYQTTCLDFFDNETNSPGGGCFKEDLGRFVLTSRYYDDARNIAIYDLKGRQVLSIDVSGFSNRTEPAGNQTGVRFDFSSEEYKLVYLAMFFIFALAAIIYLRKKHL